MTTEMSSGATDGEVVAPAWHNGRVAVEEVIAESPSEPGPGRARSNDVLELTGEVTPVRVLVGDLWRCRGLVPMLAAKDFHSRYRSATFGVLWSVFLPLIQGAILAVVFTRVVHIGIDKGDNYPIFVITGTVLWAYFSASLTTGSTTLVDQGGIASKVYFPRLILSATSPLANAVSFVISMAVALILMPFFGVSFHPEIAWLLVAMVLVFVEVVLFSAICSIAHVYFRDVRYGVAAILMVAMYATPIIYPLDKPHGWLRALITANPMSGPAQLTHFAVFGHAPSLALSLIWTAAWVAALIVGTLLAYRRYERVACDRL
jgi:lipopolysaccharide transport system permease protein